MAGERLGGLCGESHAKGLPMNARHLFKLAMSALRSATPGTSGGLWLALFLLLASASILPAQWQTAKLTAEDATSADKFGNSVAMSGDTALFGAPGKDGKAGTAYIMHRDAWGNWSEHVRLNARDRAGDDQFGISVALSGDTALVGAKFEDEAGTNSGAAYVFVRDVTGNWVQQAKLMADDSFFGEQFGISVALNGDTALVGAGHQSFPPINGAAYVFLRDGSGHWSLQAKLTASDGENQDAFGEAVALDGDTALIGAWHHDQVAGAAYVYVRDAAGNWTEQKKLLSSSNGSQERFGRSVSVHGDRAVVGATAGELGAVRTGTAFVFSRDASGFWTEETMLSASDAALNDAFGGSVAIRGDLAMVGKKHAAPAYLFTRDELGNWSEQDRLEPEGSPAGFGGSVALMDDRVLVGAGDEAGAGAVYEFCLGKLTAEDPSLGAAFGGAVSLHDDTALVGARSNNMGTGAGYVFTRDAGGLWRRQAKLTASDGASLDFLGEAVSVHGHTALIGTGNEAAYVFVRDAMGSWTEQDKLTAADGASDDTFGESVSLFGDTALVGARFDDDFGDSSGSAYVFVRDGAGNWSEQAKLTASDGSAGAGFGHSVSLYGNRALIGAAFDSSEGVSNAGAAYVFVRDVGGSWTEQKKLTAPAANLSQLFGSSVSISGETVLVGASGDNHAGFFTGSAFVFVQDGAGNWIQQGKLTASDAAEQANFGDSVSLSGNGALIGTRGTATDSAYWFHRETSGNWTQRAQLKGDAGASLAFGNSVSLYEGTALVGDGIGDAPGIAGAGTAHLFCGNPGTLLTIGSGCTGTTGIPRLAAVPGEVPTLGESYGLEITGLPPNPGNTVFGIFGLSKTSWAGVPLPLDATPFGFTGCKLYVSIRKTPALYNLGGTAFWRLEVPNMTSVIGLPFYLQAGVVDFGANPGNVVFSNAGEAVIGGR